MKTTVGMKTTPPSSTHRRIGLVGCVKEKARRAMPAQDLYTSTLFMGRRRYVESTCNEWWILSAEHGLVHPATELVPYDVTLKDAGRAQRRRWSARVLSSIDGLIHPEPQDVVEIHAGVEYRDYGLLDGLLVRGCVVGIPTKGMRIGEQLRFYKEADPE
jgi:hypothetical protein